MTKKSNPLLDESITWIRNHPTATNHDIPVNLRDSWIYNRNDESDVPGYQLAVFTYGLCSRRLAGKVGEEFSISASEVLQLFELWQMKLGLAEMNEKTEIKTKPLALYDFPIDEKIEYWYNEYQKARPISEAG